jgi:Trk-type K+ transport system membrane component
MIILSCIVFSINFILNKIIHALAEKRRYRSFTDKQRFLIISLFVVVLINSGLLVLLIRAEFSDIEDSPNKSGVESISLLRLFRSVFSESFS